MWNAKLGPGSFYLVCLMGLVAMGGVAFSEAAGSEPLSVVHCPDQGVPLEARWQWALGQIPAHPRAERLWIGFSTQQLMHENSWVGRWPVHPDYPTLSELVYGVRVELPRFAYSRQKTPRTVAKEIACLLEIDRASGRIEQAQTSDVSLTVYLGRGVLFWLGETDQEQSVSLMQSLYRSAEDDEWKARLVAHIAETQSDQVLAFLDGVLQKEKSPRVRQEAVHALAGYENQKALDILLRTVRQDSSEAVQREAVGIIGCLGLPAAETAMIDLAEAGPSPSVRREAIYGLQERTSPAVVKCFGDIIDSQNQPRENQRAALDALAGVDSPEALNRLILTARKHADPRTRHEAIDRLRDRDSPTVVHSLATIVNEDKIESTQRKALEALADMESQEAVSAVIRIAQTHTNPKVREEAIDRLRDRASPETRECLLGIIRSKKEPEKFQRKALETLADVEEDDTLDLLMQIAQTHARPSIRRQAIDGLRRWDEYGRGSPAAINCLVSIIGKKDESEEIRREALEQLAEYGTKDARAAVIQIATTHASPRLREEAIGRLGDTENLDPEALPEIIAALESIIDNQKESEEVQRRALEVLRETEDPGILAYLKKTAQGHPNRDIRREAQEIVAQEMAESWNQER